MATEGDTTAAANGAAKSATEVFNGDNKKQNSKVEETKATLKSVKENLSNQLLNFYINTDEIYGLIDSTCETVTRVQQAEGYLNEQIANLDPITQDYARETYKIDEKIESANQISKDIVDYLEWLDTATKDAEQLDKDLGEGLTPTTGGGSGGGTGGGGGGGTSGGGYTSTPYTYTPYTYTPATYTPYTYTPYSYTPTPSSTKTPTTTKTDDKPTNPSYPSYTTYPITPSYTFSPSPQHLYGPAPVQTPIPSTVPTQSVVPTTYPLYGPAPTQTPVPSTVPTQSSGPGGPGNGDGPGSGTGTGSGGLGEGLASIGSAEDLEREALSALAGTSLLSVLGKGTSKLASKLSPSLGSAGQKNVANKVLAGAGLALGAASIAGGVYLATKNGYYVFTPDDWIETEEDVRNEVINDFIEEGMTSDEIETFKASTYRILTSELNEHVRKVEIAFSVSESIVDQIIEMYHFSLFDENDDIDRYLLFLIMAIDGRNPSSDVNLYNILNPYLEEEDIDFIYAGIHLNEYEYEDEDEEDIDDLTTEEESENY